MNSPTTQVAEPPGLARDKRLSSLLVQCHKGSQRSFEELYRLSSGRLYGVLLRILRVDALAEEALQETFIKIWQKAGSFSPEKASPMVWMCSVARNQALDMLRRRKVREDHERTNVSELIDSTIDHSKSLGDMSDDASMLMKCLEHLPENARTCVVRAYCEGYSQEALASDLGAPVSTVKSWIRRGLISLRACINGFD